MPLELKIIDGKVVRIETDDRQNDIKKRNYSNGARAGARRRKERRRREWERKFGIKNEREI